MGAQGIKLSEEDIYFIRYQYKYAKNQKQMLTVLKDLFLISQQEVCEIVGAKPVKAKKGAAYKPEECEIILKFWKEGIDSVKERLERAGFDRSVKAIRNKHLALITQGKLSTNGKGLTWSDEEDRYIMENAKKPSDEIAEELYARFGTIRSRTAINNRRQRIREAL